MLHALLSLRADLATLDRSAADDPATASLAAIGDLAVSTVELHRHLEATLLRYRPTDPPEAIAAASLLSEVAALIRCLGRRAEEAGALRDPEGDLEQALAAGERDDRLPPELVLDRIVSGERRARRAQLAGAARRLAELLAQVGTETGVALPADLLEAGGAEADALARLWDLIDREASPADPLHRLATLLLSPFEHQRPRAAAAVAS